MVTLKGSKGFTLLEFVVVIALAAVVLTGTAIAVNKGRESALFGDINNELQSAIAGFAEMKVVRGGLLNTAEGVWVSVPGTPALKQYLPESMHSSPPTWNYQCSGNHVYLHPTLITTKVPSAQRANLLQRLIDAGTCVPYAGDGVPYSAGKGSWIGADHFVCEVKAFSGNARCR